MKNEFNLLEFYEQIYSKGEKKHFTPFLKSTKTIERNCDLSFYLIDNQNV